jgi:integration host factor subunit beta
MNKSDIIEELATLYSIPRKNAESIVQSMFKEMKASLERSERVEFRGFGTFTVREYEGYVGRNPKTGEQAMVPSKKRVRFRMSEVLFNRMNKQFEAIANTDD